MSDAIQAVQWLSATGTLDQIAREVLAPAIAAALNENSYDNGYAAGVKAERERILNDTYTIVRTEFGTCVYPPPLSDPATEVCDT